MSVARILLVDDDPAVLDALPQALHYRMDNVIVHAVDSPTDALRLLDHQRYDAVLADICLPRMDGYQFLRAAHDRWPELPIIMFSGHVDADAGSRLTEAGAYGFLPKPLDRNSLVALTKHAVQLSHLMRQLERQRTALQHCICDAHVLADALRAEDEAQTALPFTDAGMG
jgi:DNA-binding NtrC family response regulator